jgi:hypothetical protein
MKKLIILLLFIGLFTLSCKTQQKLVPANNHVQGLTEPQKRNYWQQKVNYKIFADLDTAKNQYKGKINLTYLNNSPDTLKKAYFHLYWNAFQPGSAMDWRNRWLEDPDRNLEQRIRALKPDEIGFIKINQFSQNKDSVKYSIVGTVMEVELNKPLLPGDSTVFDIDYLTQIPLLLRRSGRDNKEGIEYSMAQWYPQIAEYDLQGWHTDPYIGREFYNVWGDFDVQLKVPASYMVAATGQLQNPQKIGKGYIKEAHPEKDKNGKLTWHFTAKNVHDFVWAADPDYIHDIIDGPEGVKLHFFYQNNPDIIENWKKLQPIVAETMAFYNKEIGKYPYPKYNVIQAGDGGMEYAMGTFVYGNKPYKSLRGTVQHELGHAWFQFTLATNEAQYPWMDEGFTSYIQDLANVFVNGENQANPFARSYSGYRYLVNKGKDEPLSTFADHYHTNLAYWIGAYDKGKMVLSQLGYIMGFDQLNKTLKEYYKNWKMKHPQPDDFFKIAQKISGMDLRVFKNDWIETTHHIDYAIDKVEEKDGRTYVTIKRKEDMVMPLDIVVRYQDGNQESFYIPLDILRGEKNNPFPKIKRTVLKDWKWAIPHYQFVIDKKKEEIDYIVIDPLGFMADLNPENNTYENGDNRK